MAKLISYEEATGAEPNGKLISYEKAAGAPSSPRSAIGEIANQGYAGAVSDLPQMIGKAMQYSSDPGHAIYDAGKSLSDWATKQGERPDLQAHPDQHNVVTNALASGARMIPQSIAPAAVVGGALAAAPVGLSGAALLGASALLGSAPAAMSQGQETLDKGLAAGLPRDKAIEAARINALIEGGGETLGTYAGGKLFGIGANAIGKIAKSGAQGGAGKALSELTSPGIVKPWLKQIPETAAVEVGTEIGQNAGEAAIERAYGVDNKSPYEAGKEAIAPTLGMTALLAPFGLAGFASGAHFARQKAAALSSPETAKESRAQISDEYYAELAKVDQSAANNFKANADMAIVSGSELPIDESLFSPTKQSPITTAAASAVRSGATFKAEFDRVMREEQALAAEQAKTAKQGPKNEQSQEASTQGSAEVSQGPIVGAQESSGGIGATSAGAVPGQPASAIGQVSGADTGVAEQPAGGGLSQSQIVQTGAATPAVEPVEQPTQGAIQPDANQAQEAITPAAGQQDGSVSVRDAGGPLQKGGVANNQPDEAVGPIIQGANGFADGAQKHRGELSVSSAAQGSTNPGRVEGDAAASLAQNFGTPAQPTTGGILPQQSTALDVPSTLQGRSQVKTSQDRSKAVSKEGSDAIDLSSRTDKQLAYLSTNGRPGYKEAAIAEIAKRAGTSQPAKVVSSLPTSPAAKMGSGQGYEYGKIGGMLKTGQIVLTASGRKTTPFPRFAFKTGRTTNAHVHAVDQWLLQNAADEAVARGDSFNAPVFQADVNQKSIPQASKDAAEEYLFGEQPAVLPSILKPLVADKKPANEVQTPEPKVAATVKDNLTVAPTTSEGSRKTAVEVQQTPAIAGESIRAYDKAKATDLAKRMTKQGVPSEAYPHPTIADRYAIRKVEAVSSAKEPATPLQESGAPSAVVQPSQQPDAVAAPKAKPTMADRRAAAEAKRKSKADDEARKVADSAPKMEEKPLWQRTVADAVGPQVVIPEVDRYPRIEKIARETPENLSAMDKALLDKKKKQVSARAKAMREHKPYLERANAHYAAVKDAIARGEAIPDEVKADYPHLFKNEQKPVQPAKAERGEVGASLTKKQRKSVLKTLTDVYKTKRAPREHKGVDRNGNDKYGYVHSPDLFEKSDITGSMIRYVVTLPDGRIAHPTELFADYTQSDIDKAMAESRAEETRDADNAKWLNEQIDKRANADRIDARRALSAILAPNGNRIDDGAVEFYSEVEGTWFVVQNRTVADSYAKSLSSRGYKEVAKYSNDAPQGEKPRWFPKEYADGTKPAKAEKPAQPAKQYRYALVNRPASMGAVPKVEFTVEPRPAAGKPHHDLARHGIMVTDRKLTDEELKSYELAVVADEGMENELAKAVAGDFKEHAAAWVEDQKDDPKGFAAAVGQALGRYGNGVRYSISDRDAFAGKVLANIKAQPAKPEPAAKPEAVTLSSHDALMKSARAGTLPADDLKAAFAATKENESAIMAELSAMTKDALLKRMGGIAAARWKSDKKADVVRAAWSDMLSDFALSRPYSYSMGKDSQAKAIAALVESTTDKDIADFAAKVESQTKDYLERLNNYKKAITNPESLEDFRTFVRVNGEAGLTVEQRARYDDLRSDDTRASSQEKRATVGAAYVKVGAKLVETKHTRDGHDLFVVQLETRVERDAFDRLNSSARKLGGRWSHYAKGGAIPGFQFKDKASAEAFQKLASEGDTTAAQEVVTDRVESSKVERKSAAAERLTAIADRMEAKGNEALSRDRLTNTAKRARQASSAEADASALVAMAKTMRNLAAAIQSGEAKHLEGINNRAQVEMLDAFARNAQRKTLRKKYPSYADQEMQKGAPLTVEDAAAAEWPTATADRGDLLSVIRLLAESGKPTVKALSAKIERLANTSSERIPVPIEIIEQVRSKLVGTQQQRSIPWYWEMVQERVKRLASMGIADLPMLRAAIREYVQFKESAPKANKAKELERALIGNKSIGIDFFPTPKSVAQDMVRMADIQPGMKVLEPSAGNGNIAEAIEAAGVAPDVVEMSGSLREILDAKGFNIVGQDFMQTSGNYDRIVMNPPFSNRMDAEHVQHAYTLLNPGGKIVAIMGEGVFFGSDTKAKQFREWLDSVGGTSEKLPDGTFTDRTLMATTGVNSRMVEIDKPGDTRFNVASNMKISPADSAVYEMARDGKSAAEILEFLGKASRNGFNRYLANALRNLGVSSTIKIDSMGGWNFNQSKQGAKYAAAYSPKTDTIALFTPREAERHILHEFTHAATLKAIMAGGRPALEMKRLFEHVKASGKLDGMYGMTNLDEFVAEAFSNPEFQRALMKVLAPRGYTVKTAWDAFVRFVARLVGIKTPALQSALDKAMVLGAELMRENAKLSGKGGDTRFAIAHHGTPHLFAPEPGFPHGRFRLDKIGTGEGAQAYGWGVYFASNNTVAEAYKKAGARSTPILYNGKSILDVPRDEFSALPEITRKALIWLKDNDNIADAMTDAEYSGVAGLPEEIKRITDAGQLSELPEGTIYRLDIPDDVMPKLMDWDEPLSEQPAAVRKALEASGVVNFTENIGPTSTGDIRNLGWSSNVRSMLGDKFYHRLIEKEFTGKPTTSTARREAEKAASEYLASIGIPGLRYLDGQSRTDGAGTHNYVIWDQPTLDRIALLERNGEKLDDIRFSQESDTINVDGTERPRTNSNGKPIAAWKSSPTISRESVLSANRIGLNEHASGNIAYSMWYSPEHQEAYDYGIEGVDLSVQKTVSGWRRGESGFGGQSYNYRDDRRERGLSMMSVDGSPAGHSEMFMSDRKKYEYKGILLPEKGSDGEPLIIPFGGENIDREIFDNGEFSPDNPDIRFNVESSDQWVSSSADNNTLDDIIYKIANKQIDLRRTVQDITKKIGEIADEYNPELAETLYHGRAANETKNFLDFELRPLIRRMLALGVDTETLETYLWARHAEERNEQIAKINPRLPDGGSGLTNEQARQLLAGQDVTIDGKTIKGVPQDKLVEIGELSSMSDAILKRSRELLVDSGLESKAEVDSWSSMYQHYVPLHREEFADDRMTGKGLGMSIKGPSGKRAIGSEKPVSNILASIVSQREMYITRAEKNKVGNATYSLATIAPNEDFWQAIDPMANASRDAQQLWAKIRKQTEILASKPDGDEAMEAIIDAMKAQHKALMKKAVPGMKKVKEALEALGLPAEMADRILAEPKELTINKRTGMVVERVNPLLRHLDNVLSTRINGRDVFVVFNARNKRSARMAMAMKNLDADNLGFLLGNMAKATRYFSAINTQFNPIFGVTNLTRDIQTAMLNLSSTPLAGHKIEIAKRTFSALRGIYSDLRNHREGMAPTSQWAATFEQFKKHGGATGYRDMYDTLNDRAKDLQDELKKMSMGKGRRLATLGQSNPVFAWLSDYNEMMENAVRVAAFSVAIEQDPATGRPRMSPAQAAALAKELTVNFNRKGQVAAQAGAMYAFFNAAVQGTARIAQTLVTLENGKPKLTSAGKKIIAGGVMVGVVQAILGALAGWDDEEPPQFVRERSLIIPFGDHYFSIPMPLGYNVLPNIGRITTEFALSGFKYPAKRISSMINVLFDTFNPIGNAGMSLQTIAPTVIDPLAALSENKDWTGKPIKRMTFNEEAAGYKNAKDTATVWSKLIAEGLNYLTGGTEHKAGLMSPTPDQIDYLIGQVTGGVGREVSKVVQTGSSVISGEELPLYKVPLVGKFVGSTTGQAAESSRFYANIQELKAHKAEIDGRRKAHQDVSGYIQDNPDARLVPMATRIEHRVQELRRAKRALLEKNAPQDQVKAIDARITAYMKALNGKVEALQRSSR